MDIVAHQKKPAMPLPPESSYQPEDWAILSRHWYPVARIDEIGDTPFAATLLDVKLVIYRAASGIVIARDSCPHRGVPLSLGAVVRGELVCPYHGLSFAADGRCTRIPAQPDITPSARLSVRVFPAVQHLGLVWTCLAADGPPTLPPLPEWDDPSYETILPPYIDIAGSPARQVEGFIDVAHFAFVHEKAFADPENVVVPSYETEITAFGLRSNYISDISNYPKGLQHLAPPDFQWLRAFEVYAPFCAKLTVHFPGTQRYHILNVASPVSTRKTRLFVPIARNFDTLGSVESILAFNAQIFAEDAAIVQTQRPVMLDAKTAEEEHFAADRSSVTYRRVLKQMGLTQA
jgi:phenylpropionate dioxygenase-like ring-hydroxylating dioxygenase large terminal subunit